MRGGVTKGTLITEDHHKKKWIITRKQRDIVSNAARVLILQRSPRQSSTHAEKGKTSDLHSAITLERVHDNKPVLVVAAGE